MTGFRRMPGIAAILVGLGLAVSGCSSGGREYAIPKQVCEFPVGEDVVSPILPDGERVDSGLYETSSTIGVCDLRVDRKTVMSVEIAESGGPFAPEDWEPSKFDRGMIVGVPGAQKALVGSERALASAQCGGDYRWLAFRFFFYIDHVADPDQRVKDVTAFVSDFVPSVKRDLGCAA